MGKKHFLKTKKSKCLIWQKTESLVYGLVPQKSITWTDADHYQWSAILLLESAFTKNRLAESAPSLLHGHHKSTPTKTTGCDCSSWPQHRSRLTKLALGRMGDSIPQKQNDI